MTKTAKTKEIEQALIDKMNNELGCYGALEVTVSDIHHNDERADFVTINAKSEITCYEIKVSWSDLHSKAKLTYLGDKNYLVVTSDLYDLIKQNNYGTCGVGIMVLENGKLKVVKRCSHHNVDFATRATIVQGVARAASRDAYRKKKK